MFSAFFGGGVFEDVHLKYKSLVSTQRDKIISFLTNIYSFLSGEAKTHGVECECLRNYIMWDYVTHRKWYNKYFYRCP